MSEKEAKRLLAVFPSRVSEGPEAARLNHSFIDNSKIFLHRGSLTPNWGGKKNVFAPENERNKVRERRWTQQHHLGGEKWLFIMSVKHIQVVDVLVWT